MKKIILICLLFLAYSTEGVKCPSYDRGLSADPCLTIEEKDNRYNYKINPCPKGKYCNLDFNAKESKCIEFLNERFPGEYCENKDDCQSGKCENGKCANITHNGSCDNHANCSLGHFCHSATKECTKVKALDESCNKGEMCGVGLACNNNTCVTMFSIKNGSRSTSSAACETFFARNGICVEGLRLDMESLFGERNDKSKEPVICKGECPYIAENRDRINSSCVCGMDFRGTEYCNPGLGDIDIDDVYLYNL